MSWATKVVGSPTVARDTGAHTASCTLTSASEKQDAVLYEGDTKVWCLDNGANVDMRVKIPVLPTLSAGCYFGLAGNWTDGPDAITYSVLFAVDVTGAVYCTMDDNATDRSAASGVTVLAGEYHQFRIDASNKADVTFWIDGVQVATGTTFNYAATAGANSTLQLYMSAYKASGAGVGTVTMDAVRAWHQNR